MGKRVPAAANLDHQYLVSGLMAGFDWFDQSLQNVLASRGLPTLNKTQAMVMLYITAGVHRPSEIARKMGVSRQAIWYLSRQLVELGLIEVADDEQHKGGRRLLLCEGKDTLRAEADQIILDLEQLLEARIGAENVAALRQVLQLDWGRIAQQDARR